jgi:hypothetical protein
MRNKTKHEMTVKHGGITMKIVLSVQPAKFDPWWEDRYNLFVMIKNREAAFMALEPEARVELIEKTKAALEKIYDCVEDWLPQGFDNLSSEEQIVIDIHILKIDFEREVKKRKKGHSLRLRDALREMEEDFKSHETRNGKIEGT